MSSCATDTPLSDEEYAALNALLAAPAFGGRAMDISALEGFLTAIVIGPNLLMPGQWYPWVLDMEQGAAAAGADAGECEQISALVLRHYNYMLTWMTKEPESFEPIYECGPEWGTAQQWCAGFLLGMQIDGAAWQPLSASHRAWFAPFTALGTAEGRQQIEKENDAGRWIDEVAPAVVSINAFWAKRRILGGEGGARPTLRDTPKVGRNDPCPCGSGKKYKKCCGAAA